MLVTTGSSRVLIVNGTDAAALGTAVSSTRHPGLDRIDLLVVSGNAGAGEMAVRSVELFAPRMIIAIGSATGLVAAGIQPDLVVDHPTEIQLPEGVSITLQAWPAAGGENDDSTWAASIERGGASVYWVSDREALMQEALPPEADVTIVGRGKPADDTPFPNTLVIVTAAESISGPELRALALDSIGPEVQTARIFAGEGTRIDLDPEGIRTIPGGIPAATPAPA